MNPWRFRAVAFTAVCLVLAVSLKAQNLEYSKAHYTKYERYIPMRDGIRLFTAIYVPKDFSKPYPIMLTRTPYSVAPYGSDRYRDTLGPSILFEKEGYIFVYQDVRGRWMSEGSYEHMRPYKTVKSGPKDFDETTDTWDTIDWLVKNIPNNNGRVGMWGISYPGFYAAAALIHAHPALKAVSPQAPVADWFSSDDWHHKSALSSWLMPSAGFPALDGSSANPRPSCRLRRQLALSPTATSLTCVLARFAMPTSATSTIEFPFGTR